MSDDFENYLNDVIRKDLKQRSEALEEMCERMLTTPDSPGISVQTTWGPGYGCATITRLNPDVPFGEIHYLPDLHEGGLGGGVEYGE